jgi:TolA-binding protein
VSAYQSLLGQAKKGIWVDRARILIGEAIYQTKDYDLAMTFFGPVSRKDAVPFLRVLALYRLACIDFAKKNYTRCELTLQNLLKEYENHPLRTDWMYLLATIPVYQRDWSRTIREEGKYTSSKGGAPAPYSIPADQLIPESEFRVIWAYMALGSYGEVIKRSNRFYQKYPKNALTSYALLLQGVAYDQLSNIDKAIASYQTLVDLFPSSPAAGKAVYLMTLSLHKAKEPSRIVSALNHMNETLLRSKEIKSDEWRKNTLFWIGEGYYSIQDWPHAEETYARFIELAPESPMTPYALQGLAASQAAQNKLDKAKVYAQQSIQRAQELGLSSIALDGKLQYGKILFNQKNYEGALGQFDAYIADSTNTVRVAEALYNSGLTLYNQQYYSEAIARWKRVIDGYRFSPYRPQAYLQTGRTRFGLGQYDQSVAAFQALAANYPNTPEAQEAQFQIIMSYFNKRDLRSAFQQFSAFKSAYPSDERISTTCEQLLEAYRALGTQGGTLHSGELSELLRACPAKNVASNILWERGAALFNKKDYAAAQKYFQRIMLSYPSDEVAPQAYFYNAEAYFFLGNMEQSASAYKSFYINYPTDKMVPQAMFQVGVSFFNKKDYAKSAEAFGEFIKRYPDHQLSKDAALNVALCHKKAFKLDEAIKSYQNYLTLFPGDAKGPFIRLQIGGLLVTKGRYSEAIDELEKVPAGTPEKLEAQYRIGESYTNMHKEDQARAAYERLQQMGPRDNEFRVAGVLELAKILEAKGASKQALINVYSDLASSSKNAEIANLARMKLQELK